MIVHAYCNCKNQQPEEIKRGVIICLNCNNDVDPGDFSECDDLVPDDSAEYESRMVEDVTNDHYFG